MSAHDIAVLGVGMHPWGKWGRPFTEYGVIAARAALDDAGVDWRDVDLVVGGETVRNGYAGYVAGATFAQALGWNGARWPRRTPRAANTQRQCPPDSATLPGESP